MEDNSTQLRMICSSPHHYSTINDSLNYDAARLYIYNIKKYLVKCILRDCCSLTQYFWCLLYPIQIRYFFSTIICRILKLIVCILLFLYLIYLFVDTTAIADNKKVCVITMYPEKFLMWRLGLRLQIATINKFGYDLIKLSKRIFIKGRYIYLNNMRLETHQVFFVEKSDFWVNKRAVEG